MKNLFDKLPFTISRRSSHQDVIAPPAVVIPPGSSLPALRVLDSVAEYYQARNLQRSGGLMNAASGMGGVGDKSQFFQFLPYWLNSKQFIENTVINSWVADRFINMPVNDMFTKPREYDDDNFWAADDALKIDNCIARAMRTARKYGTGLLWLVTKENSPDTPLDANRIRPGDITNIIVVDQYDASVLIRNTNLMSPRMGQPELYQINIHQIGTFQVHATRVYRFNGMQADSSNGWAQYNKDWGISNLAHAMTDIFNDASVVQGVCHMLQEASIPVQKIDGLAEILTQGTLADEPTVAERMTELNLYKSIYKTIFMDAKDTFERTSVNFSNIPDLLEKFADRLAMAAGISATRFLGKSPDGQNSTGEGDMRNDNRTTSANQQHKLRPVYNWLDPIIARHAGTVVPDYEFPPLFEPTQKELSETVFQRTQASVNATGSSIWTEDEAKEYITSGVLPTGAAMAIEPEPMERTVSEEVE